MKLVIVGCGHVGLVTAAGFAEIDDPKIDDLFAGRGYDIPKMQAQMRARMQAEGLPYGNRTMTYNSRLAQELGAWADGQPGGEGINADIGNWSLD